MDPAGLAVNTKQCTQGKRLFLRGLTDFIVLPKFSLHISEGEYFLLNRLCPFVSVVRLVFLILGGVVLLSGCVCAGVANNEVALGLCQLSEQF